MTYSSLIDLQSLYKKETISRYGREYKRNGSKAQLVRQYTLHICSLAYSGLCKRHGRKELHGDKLAFCRGLQWAPEHQGNVGYFKAKHEVLYSFGERRRVSKVIKKQRLLFSRVRL